MFRAPIAPPNQLRAARSLGARSGLRLHL